MSATLQNMFHTSTQALEGWAPVTVMNAVRALGTVGVKFEGPILLHQSVHAQVCIANGQSYTVVRREQTRIVDDQPLRTIVNWKVKYSIPVNYPGNYGDIRCVALCLSRGPCRCQHPACMGVE